MESDEPSVKWKPELDKEPNWWHQVQEVGPREEDDWSDSNEEEIEFDNDNGQQDYALREGHIVPFTEETQNEIELAIGNEETQLENNELEETITF